ncbi:MAG TPA: PLP-dependent aminotransferase family protein [Thermomicrobiales bacterium]|nr:PLP-dependent aminotransferase family protein [Thermomicrobiales bacterium]
MDERWNERWSRRGKIAAKTSRPSRTSPKDMISFSFGNPDLDSLPLDEMVEAAEFLAENNRRDSLVYADPVGPDGLAAALAEKLHRDYELNVTPDQILLTSGASSGLSLVVDMLVDPGDIVLADAPAWMGATGMFRLAGAEVIGVEVDDDGVDPAKVEAALDKLAAEGKQAKFLYTIPTFQNPAGVELSVERRHKLAKIADERGLLILEDDAYIDLRFEGEKKPTMFGLANPGSVLLFGTLSKTIAAGLRLGWCAGPADIIAVLGRGRSDTLRNTYTAALAEWYVTTGRHAEHIANLQQIYKGKCAHMLAALDREMPEGVNWTKPNGGFFLWLTLPEGVDSIEMQPAAREHLVDYIPGPAFYSDGSGRRSLRLSFSAVTMDQIDEGIARLAGVVKAAMPSAAPAD